MDLKKLGPVVLNGQESAASRPTNQSSVPVARPRITIAYGRGNFRPIVDDIAFRKCCMMYVVQKAVVPPSETFAFYFRLRAESSQIVGS